MKRRTFIHAIGAAGALGLTGHWTLAEAVGQAARVQPLTAVFDRLPSLLTAAARVPHYPGLAPLLTDGIMKAAPRATSSMTGIHTFTPW